jgi:pectinesterase
MHILNLLLLLPVTLAVATGITKPPKGSVVVDINSSSPNVFKSVSLHTQGRCFSTPLTLS